MITIKNPSKREWEKQHHFKAVEENVKKHGYYIEQETFYHDGYACWFTTSNWVIGKKHNFLMKKKLFTFRYSDGVLTIFEYKKKDYAKVVDTAMLLFDDIEGLECIIENLYCFSNIED